MDWQFNFTDGKKTYRLRAEMMWATYQIEDIKITGDGISVLLQNNRPLLVAIESTLPITWKVIEGELPDPALAMQIKKSLEADLKKVPVKSNLASKLKVA